MGGNGWLLRNWGNCTPPACVQRAFPAKSRRSQSMQGRLIELPHLWLIADFENRGLEQVASHFPHQVGWFELDLTGGLPGPIRAYMARSPKSTFNHIASPSCLKISCLWSSNSHSCQDAFTAHDYSAENTLQPRVAVCDMGQTTLLVQLPYWAISCR